MADCNENESKIIGIVLIPETPFEKGMSIYTHQLKRDENAQKILDNLKDNIEHGTAVIINKPCIDVKFETYKTECRKYSRILFYHPSNSKKGFPIKGTNLRVSFEYI